MVTLTHGQFVAIGSVALVALCYAVAAHGPSHRATQRSHDDAVSRREATVKPSLQVAACRAVANSLGQRLPADWNVVVHEPFVLGGDCSADSLDATYHETILPTVRALSIQYFDHAPTWPITILLCSTDASYRECNQRLEARERSEYSGIYSRTEHRLVVNVATGDGTLAHELTHALAHADFPTLPEWLDEGLASLHEECEFSADGLRLVGLDNWRGTALREACQREPLRSVSDLASNRFAASDRAATDYAHTRYFCLFLQQKRLLEPFYRKCRSRVETDPTGIDSLCELFATTHSREIEVQFTEWLAKSAGAGGPSLSRRAD